MKPLSPILFLTAVHAVALLRHSDNEDIEWSVAFVREVGRISHLAGTWESSSWPLLDASTVDELVAAARERGMLRKRPSAGDIVVFGSGSVGVVLEVTEKGIGDLGHSTRCRVATATRGLTGERSVEILECWCGNGRGDVFIRWYEGTLDERKAS